MISFIWFIIILSVIVISHEFGHYLIARKNGIHVVEFDVGMGPTLFHFSKKGTKFAVKLLPFGGACVFEGMDGSGLVGGKETDSPDSEKLGKPFNDANVWARIATVFAGPMFNFILAMIFSIVIVGFCGTDLPVIQGITEGRAAETAGLMVGDQITKINGERINLWRDISLISILNDGETLTIEYKRDGQKYKTQLVPTYVEEDNRYYIGIEGGTTYVKAKGLNIFSYSWYELRFNFRNTLKSLKQLILGKLTMDDVSGPVGIAQVVGETYENVKDYGVSSVILTMMNISMLLSVNLGVLNLLPLPALDGGRLVFLLVEVVRGKPVPPEKEGIVHLVGIVLFFILAVFVLFNDVMRLIGR